MLRHRQVPTSRLKVHIREAGSGEIPVILVHGNASSSVFYEDLMAALPPPYRAIAPDLRGMGETEPLPIDATRGCGDWSDDLEALVQALGLTQFHLVGWSMGGTISLRYAIDHSDRLLSLTLIAPVPPFGYGGNRGPAGEPNYPDCAGSGGGAVNADFVRLIAAGDRGHDHVASPRNILNHLYFNPPFRGTPEQEERWLEGILSSRTGDDWYPGNKVDSPHWPYVAPGDRGVLNAISPKYHNLSAFPDIQHQVPVLWVRGDADRIISDTSSTDMAYLGQIGAVAGWPGPEVCPPQPMVGQTRALLEAYRARGGTYREVVYEGVGHAPHIERAEAFLAELLEHLGHSRP